MGNKIGDYIHWKYDNYLQYGIRYSSEKTKYKYPPDINAIFNTQRQTILNEVLNRDNQSKQNIKTSIENKLNYYFNLRDLGLSSQKTKTGISADEIQQAFIDAFNKKYKAKEISIDNNLQAGEDTKRIGEINSYYKPLAEHGTNSYLAIANRLAQIQSAYGRISANINQTNAPILEELKKFDADWNTVIEEVIDFIDDLGEQLRISGTEDKVCIKIVDDELISIKKIQAENKKNANIVGAGRMRNASNEEDFAKALNKVYKSLQRATSAYYTGIAGEAYVGYMMAITPEITKKQLNKLLNIIFGDSSEDKAKLGLVGQQSTPGFLKMDLFATTNDLGEKNNRIKDDKIPDYVFHLSNQRMELKPTQDKVDMIFTLNNEQIGASIKNYNLSFPREINILDSSTGILRLVQQYTVFLNHYLNITATHDKSGEQPSSYLINGANRIMLLTISLKALVGGVYKLINNQMSFSQQAELFVVNDNSTGRYQVYFTSDIIKLLNQNLHQIEKLIKVDGFSLKQTWTQELIGRIESGSHIENQKNAYRRILGLLNTLDTGSLHIQLQSSVLDRL